MAAPSPSATGQAHRAAPAAAPPRVDDAVSHALAELATALTPPPGDADLATCRTLIDAVDSVLGVLLARRVELVELAQAAKQGRDLPPRDRVREAEIARRLAARVPRLGPGGAAAVMAAVVDACLDAAAPVPA